jgi:hypothetical protein
MRFGFIRPGHIAHAIATHRPNLQQFASEAVPALREAAPERGPSGIGERP